jgi:hypothetical protein
MELREGDESVEILTMDGSGDGQDGLMDLRSQA